MKKRQVSWPVTRTLAAPAVYKASLERYPAVKIRTTSVLAQFTSRFSLSTAISSADLFIMSTALTFNGRPPSFRLRSSCSVGLSPRSAASMNLNQFLPLIFRW